MKVILITSGGRVLEVDRTDPRHDPRSLERFYGDALKLMRKYDRPEQAKYSGSVARIFVSEGGTLGEYSRRDLEELAGEHGLEHVEWKAVQP